MQTFHHTMAHRGPGATRTNARWHPYTPPRPTGCLPSGAASCSYATLSQPTSQQNQGYLLTPASAIHQFTPASNTFSQSPLSILTTQKCQLQAINPPPATKVPQARSSSDHGFVAVLLEQTVKSLSDIWRPEGIPAIFKKNHQVYPSTSRESIPDLAQTVATQQLDRKSVQLPSPCSPTLQSIPASTADPSHTANFLHKHYSNAPFAERELLPLRHFVREVLYRSRTTRPVLESALCYIEAVRKKIPDLVEKERQGLGVWGEPELGNRVVKETDDAYVSSSSDDSFLDSTTSDKTRTELMSMDSNVPTVLQVDATLACHDLQQTDPAPKRRKVSTKPLPPLVPLPSPLLCPRRTFLAALILASKFLQDRCYSNRAWAKLSGLPPREVGRCERALGEALEWRLWVGKGANFGESGTRGVSRSRSENTLSFGSSAFARGSSHMPSPPLSDAGASPEIGRTQPGIQSEDRSLKRAATLPNAAAFRCVPPRYRQPGSLPFSFAGPPIALASALGMGAQSSFVPTYAPRPLRPEPTMILSEEPTPRMFCSPLPMSEASVDTPSTAYGNSWSPAPSTTSTDSSDSGSSVGSVATPPDLARMKFGKGLAYSDTNGVRSSDSGLLASDRGKLDDLTALTGVRVLGADAMENWYSQVLSSRALMANGQLPMLGSMDNEYMGRV